jgi:glycosyltransferase involved in cell wall biosynthesis
MHRPLVSVVVPVYNGARYLRRAIDSALAQTYRDVEVLVVDDGSKDDSPEVIAGYGPRLRALRQANGGVARARNAAIRASSGELIAFLDQDDWWLPGKVAAQVQRLLAEPEVGLAHTSVLQYSEAAGSFVEVYPTEASAGLQGHCYERLLLGNGIFNSSVMVRSAVLADVGVLDAAMPGNTVQDYDLWLRVARRHRLAYVPERLTVIGLHGDQGTRDRRAMLTDELGLLERVLGRRGLQASPAMRSRVAALLDQLGVAHLDAGDPRRARPCFGRAVGLRRSVRTASLYAVSFLPPGAIDWVRRHRRRWSSPAPASLEGRGPL